MDEKQFKEDIKIIKLTFNQYWNGWHLEPAEWLKFRQALKRVNKLKKVIPEEVGVI